MASTEEPQITLVQEDSFEMVEHSDAVEDQCQDAVPALTDTEKKVKELEKKLEEMNDKQKALEYISLVLMWIDEDEIVAKHEGDSTFVGQASRPTLVRVTACRYCRLRKIRCSGIEASDDGRCTNCQRFQQECTFTPVWSQAQAFVPAHTAYPHLRNTGALPPQFGGRPLYPQQGQPAFYGAPGQPLGPMTHDPNYPQFHGYPPMPPHGYPMPPPGPYQGGQIKCLVKKENCKAEDIDSKPEPSTARTTSPATGNGVSLAKVESMVVSQARV